MQEETRRFIAAAGVFFLIIAGLVYLPVFNGHIALPADAITGFPPWEGIVTQSNRPMPDIGDVVTLFYPWRFFMASVVRQGEIPEWNPHILGGTPFIASAQSAIFYPLNVLFYILPVPTAWTVKLLLYVFLAGMMTALLSRSLGANWTGALASGVIFSLSGFMTVWQAYTIGETALWLPLICLATHRMYVLPSMRSAALGAVAYAMPQLSGHPETSVHLVFIGCLFFLWLLASGTWAGRDIARRVAYFGAAGTLAVGAASVQLLPILEWTAYISRTTDMEWGVVRGRELLAFFSRDLATTPNSSNLMTPESAAYAGMATLLLAPFALYHRSRREVLFFGLLVVLSLQIATGLNPGDWLATHTPIVSGIKNWRLIGAADFGLAILAAFGITTLCQGISRKRALVVLTVFSASALYAIWVLNRRLISPVDWLSGPAGAALAIGLAAVLIGARLSERLNPRLFGSAIVLLLCLDMVSFSYGFMSFAPLEKVYPPAPLFDFLRRQDPLQSRVINLDVYPANAEIVYGLSSAGGYEIALKSVKELLTGATVDELDTISFNAENVVNTEDRRLDLMNAKYVVTSSYNTSTELLSSYPERFQLVFSDRNVHVFENLRALPRAHFVAATPRAIEVLTTPEERLARLRDRGFDPEHSVVLDQPPAGLATAENAAGGHPSRVTRLESRPNQYSLRVDAQQPGILVFSEVYYPGWGVFVDGQPAAMLQPNHAFMGVALQPGAHDVRFEFKQRSVRLGASITGLSLIVIAGAFVLGRRKRVPALEVPIREPSTAMAFYDARIAPRLPFGRTFGMAIAVILAVALWVPIFPQGTPELSLDKTEVQAGKDSYVLSVPQMRYGRLEIRYTLDGSEPKTFEVRLNSDGEIHLEVGANTAKGVYHLIDFREQESTEWIPANATIVVK